MEKKWPALVEILSTYSISRSNPLSSRTCPVARIARVHVDVMHCQSPAAVPRTNPGCSFTGRNLETLGRQSGNAPSHMHCNHPGRDAFALLTPTGAKPSVCSSRCPVWIGRASMCPRLAACPIKVPRPGFASMTCLAWSTVNLAATHLGCLQIRTQYTTTCTMSSPSALPAL